MKFNKPISILLLLAINIMLIWLFLIPKYHESKDLTNSFIKKQAQSQLQVTYQGKITTTLKAIEAKQAVLDKIKNALPQNSSLGSTINFFQQKALENGLIVTTITKSGGQGGTQAVNATGLEIQVTTFTASFSGTYEGLKNFMKSLEMSDRIFEIGTISLVPVGSKDKVEYAFRMEFKTYSY